MDFPPARSSAYVPGSKLPGAKLSCRSGCAMSARLRANAAQMLAPSVSNPRPASRYRNISVTSGKPRVRSLSVTIPCTRCVTRTE